MEKKIFFPMLLNLQLFAEGAGGGDGGTGAGGATGVTSTVAVSNSTKGAKNPLADVKYGVQTEDTTPAAEVTNVQTAESVAQPDRNAEFEKLIKGEYKDLYDAKMQDTIQKRLKGSKEIEDKYNSLAPTLEMLARKYGGEQIAADINWVFDGRFCESDYFGQYNWTEGRAGENHVLGRCAADFFGIGQIHISDCRESEHSAGKTDHGSAPQFCGNVHGVIERILLLAGKTSVVNCVITCGKIRKSILGDDGADGTFFAFEMTAAG